VPQNAPAVIPQSAPAIVPQAGSMAELQAAMANCCRCDLHRTRKNIVFGEGNLQAKLMFIGEGPGFYEDCSGRPFVGDAGKLLDKMITAMQFTREEVYIANIVKCRPPNNRNPLPAEAACCLPFLKQQIDLIRPEVIVLLGAVAVKYLLGATGGIREMRGKWTSYENIPVLPTFHPAYLLREKSAKRDAWKDLQLVMARFGKFHRN
jgi:DNA polymerase